MSGMDLRSIFLANGVGIYILVILLYVSHTRILRNRIEDRVYIFILFGVMGGCFFEAFSYWIEGRMFAGSRILNYMANTYLYTFNLLLPLGVLFYVDLGLYHQPSRIRLRYKPQIFTALFLISLNIVNYFIPIIYYISPENIYSRRPLSYIFYAAILYFCLTSIYLTNRYEKANGTNSFFSIHMFLVPILLGTGLQFLFYGLSLAWLSSAIGLAGMYMMQQNEVAYVDPLTDTYNRQYLNHILSAWKTRGNQFAGMMIDIDRFKRINDTYGHSEGDKVINTLAGILKASCLDNEWVFRFAGDEFIILKMTAEKDGLKDYIAEMNRRIEEYNESCPRCPLSVSYGTSSFQSGNLDHFMKEIDAGMYKMKEVHHLAEEPAPVCS
jgi:diguanylate cyclase (GGDEF)-like protein